MKPLEGIVLYLLPVKNATVRDVGNLKKKPLLTQSMIYVIEYK